MTADPDVPHRLGRNHVVWGIVAQMDRLVTHVGEPGRRRAQSRWLRGRVRVAARVVLGPNHARVLADQLFTCEECHPLGREHQVSLHHVDDPL